MSGCFSDIMDKSETLMYIESLEEEFGVSLKRYKEDVKKHKDSCRFKEEVYRDDMWHLICYGCNKIIFNNVNVEKARKIKGVSR